MRYPEFVKTNARHRGPRESVKQSGQLWDAQAAIQQLYAITDAAGTKRTTLVTDIFTSYNETIPGSLQAATDDILTVKGGEL